MARQNMNLICIFFEHDWEIGPTHKRCKRCNKSELAPKFRSGDIVVHKLNKDIKMIVLGYYYVGDDMPTCRFFLDKSSINIASASALLGASAYATNKNWFEKEFNDYELDLFERPE